MSRIKNYITNFKMTWCLMYFQVEFVTGTKKTKTDISASIDDKKRKQNETMNRRGRHGQEMLPQLLIKLGGALA